MRKIKFELADTTFRARKKKNGIITLHLKTYLIVHSNSDFQTKLKEALHKAKSLRGLFDFFAQSPCCSLRLPNKKYKKCDLFLAAQPAKKPIVGALCAPFAEDIVNQESRLYLFWAKMIITDNDLWPYKHCIADMRLTFPFNYPIRERPRKIAIRKKVPVTWGRSGW